MFIDYLGTNEHEAFTLTLPAGCLEHMDDQQLMEFARKFYPVHVKEDLRKEHVEKASEPATGNQIYYCKV